MVDLIDTVRKQTFPWGKVVRSEDGRNVTWFAHNKKEGESNSVWAYIEGQYEEPIEVDFDILEANIEDNSTDIKTVEIEESPFDDFGMEREY